MESNEKINDRGLAEDFTNSLLRRYGRQPSTVDFTTDFQAFSSGQILNVRLPEHGIESQYLITSVETEYVGFSHLKYKVKAIDGEVVGGWVEFFRKLSTKGRPFSIRENEKVLLIRTARDVLSVSDAVTTAAPLEPWTNDAHTVYVTGISPIGGRKSDNTGGGQVYGPQIGMPSYI